MTLKYGINSNLLIDGSNKHSFDSGADVPRREVPEVLADGDGEADQEEGTRDDVTLPHWLLGLVLDVVDHGAEGLPW